MKTQTVKHGLKRNFQQQSVLMIRLAVSLVRKACQVNVIPIRPKINTDYCISVFMQRDVFVKKRKVIL